MYAAFLKWLHGDLYFNKTEFYLVARIAKSQAALPYIVQLYWNLKTNQANYSDSKFQTTEYLGF